MVEVGVVSVVVGCGFGAVEKGEGVVLQILVDAVVVVEDPCVFMGGGEDVFAESEVGVGVADKIQKGGHDVDLLGYDVFDSAARHTSGGVVKKDGDAVEAHRIGVSGLFGEVGVVGGDDEDGVVEPGLFACCVEEFAQGLVGVADAGVHGMAVFVEEVLVFFGYDEGVVGGGGEEGGDERLLQGVHCQGEELEKFLVPDGPSAIEIFVSTKATVLFVLGASVVLVESCGTGIGFETHGAVFGAVEEGGLVAQVFQFFGNGGDFVEGVVR